MAKVDTGSLLQHLIEVHSKAFATSKEAERAKSDAIRFAQRVLTSRPTAFPTSPDTTVLLQQLQRRLSAQGHRQLAQRLPEACQELRSQAVDEDALGSILALLERLYDTADQQVQGFSIPITSAPTASREVEPFGFDPDLRPMSERAPRDSNAGPQLKAASPITARQRVDAPGQHLSTVLVREVLCACQAISGQHIKVPPGDEDEPTVSTALDIPLPERQLMLKMSELGWLFRKLRGHASVKREAQAEGAVRQAFRGGLRQELADFYRLLATLESQADTPLPDRSQPEGPTPAYLSLRRLLVWLGDPLVQLRWLAAVADSVSDLAGGKLLSALEAAAAHGQPLVRDALMRCLKLAAAPFLAQIWLWVFHGHLQPLPADSLEFFIVSNKEGAGISGHGKMWREGYRLEESMRPHFVSPQLAQRILRAGKSLNFLRECCGDTEWTQQASRTTLASAATSLQFDQTEALESVANQAGAGIDRHVVNTLLTKYQFAAQCEAIKRYLLLGQGDFIEALMDSVGSELSKPARELSEFSLNSCLDSALRASSAQYDAPDQINRLRIKLEASQPNDDGWDVFILKYDVEEPVATVLDEPAMKAYLRMFRLLWALKRAEHSLNDCWVDLNSVQRQLTAFPTYIKRSGANAYSMEKVWEDLRQCHRLRNEMAHLVTSLQAYIMFEVVEAAWNAFMERLQTTRDLDRLIQAHKEYQQTLLRKTLLEDVEAAPAGSSRGAESGARPEVQEELRALLRQTLELRPKIRLLADMVGAACFKARMHVHDAATAEARGQWGRQAGRVPILGVVPDDLARVHATLDGLDRAYGDQLAKFVGLLPSAAHVDLRFLLFRLEAGGKGRTTDDGSKTRSTEDGGSSSRLSQP